jgi:hypothetical protein
VAVINKVVVAGHRRRLLLLLLLLWATATRQPPALPAAAAAVPLSGDQGSLVQLPHLAPRPPLPMSDRQRCLQEILAETMAAAATALLLHHDMVLDHLLVLQVMVAGISRSSNVAPGRMW